MWHGIGTLDNACGGCGVGNHGESMVTDAMTPTRVVDHPN
jgi:hypothetical protein